MKVDLQEKILELIGKYDIETQEELAEHLHREGFKVTQATVSRDIRELKLSKVSAGEGKQKYALMTGGTLFSEKYMRIFRDAFVSADIAQNLLVVKTVSGMAMAVGASLDSIGIHEIVGCIAGDDTVLVVLRTSEDARFMMDKLQELVR